MQNLGGKQSALWGIEKQRIAAMLYFVARFIAG